MLRANTIARLAAFQRGPAYRKGNALLSGSKQHLLRRRGICTGVQDSMRVQVSYFTSLCPFGVCFIHFKSPLWYFLHMCGFTVRAGPYHGRRMVLTNCSRFAAMVRQYRVGKQGTFFALCTDGSLRARLQELFDSCVDHAAVTAEAVRDTSRFEEHSVMHELRLCVEQYIHLCDQEGAQKGSVAGGGGGLVGGGGAVQLKPFSLRFRRALFDGGTAHAAARPTEGEEVAPECCFTLVGSNEKIAVAVRQALWGSDAMPPTAKQCHPVTHIFSLPSDPASVGVTATTRHILDALSESQFVCAVTSPDRLQLDMTDIAPPQCPQEADDVVVAVVSMVLSVGVVELPDLTCSLVRLHRDAVHGTLQCFVVKDDVPVVHLTTSMCKALLLTDAQLLSHNALHELRAALETNSRDATMCTDSPQAPPVGVVGLPDRRPAGLLPRWAPLNGGLTVVCVGTHDQRSARDSASKQDDSAFHLTLPASMGDWSTTSQDLLPHAAREGLDSLLEVLTRVSEDSLPVTAVNGFSELCVRESLVQSFLRSTRHISYDVVERLVKSCKLGAGTGLLIPQTTTSCGVEGDDAVEQATGQQQDHQSAVTWMLPDVVRELNDIKRLCDDPNTSGPGMTRLEKLLNEAPLLKYVGVRHADMIRFHNLDAASAKTHLNTSSSSQVKEAGASWRDEVRLDVAVENRIKEWRRAKKLSSSHTGGGSSPTFGSSHHVELVGTRHQERLGRDAVCLSLSSLQSSHTLHTPGKREEARPPQISFSYTAHLLPPRVAPAFRGVTVVACVHRNTPLRVVERSVWARVVDALPPFVSPEEIFSGCLAFPMDFVTFPNHDAVRQCVGVRLVVSVDPMVDEKGYLEAMTEAKTYLPQAMELIRRSSVPFAMEPLPPHMFGLRAATAAAADAPPQSVDVVGDEHSTVPANNEDIAAMLEFVKSTASPTELAASGIDSAATNFVCVDEASVLIYPNVVERRLQALAAVTVPDESLCPGMRVLVQAGALVIVIGSVLRGAVEHYVPEDLWQLRRTAPPTTDTPITFVIEGFVWGRDALRYLSRHANSNEDGDDVATRRQLCDMAEAFFIAQRTNVNRSRLPVVVVPLPCMQAAGTPQPLPSDVTGLLAVVVPACVTVGGRKGLYGYELPAIALPMIAATHCGLDYRFDALYSGHTGGLLGTLSDKDPFVNRLSQRLSASVFREPPHASKSQSESAALVRLAVARAAQIQSTVARHGGATGGAKDCSDVVSEIDEHLCTSTEFTAAVFY